MGKRAVISVLPKNYRSIVLHAIGIAREPRVLADGAFVVDHSERGPLTQSGIAALKLLELRDGSRPILGFEGDPRRMWISADYRDMVAHCAARGWLKVQR